MVPVFFIFTANETRVCGIDNNNYPSVAEAEKSGIEISYNFPCEFPESEESLFERKEYFEFTGMLLDFFAEPKQSQLFIRDNFNGKEYLVLSDADQGYYLPGDQIKITGQINKNTQIIDASTVNNLSAKDSIVFDCSLKDINSLNSTIDCIESNTSHTFNFRDDTKLVAGLQNHAKLDDLHINDEMRVRIDELGNIKMAIVKNRGGTNFFINQINVLKGAIHGTDVKENYFILKKDDLLIKININTNTRLVKKYFGKLNINNFKIGDDLYIVGKANDDGSFKAITIKNNSVWR